MPSDQLYPGKECIFCRATESSAVFSEEHLIPEYLGGQLVITNHVCKKCNSWLGRNVDVQISREPAIVAALDDLGEHTEKEQMLKHQFSTTMEFPSGTRLCARRAGGQVVPLPQRHPLLGMIHPDGTLIESLRKRMERAAQNRKLDCVSVDSECEKLAEASRAAQPGDVYHSVLGSVITKHSEPFEVVHHAKKSADAGRLIAKIAYEFMFLVGGHRFFETDVFCSALLDRINGLSSSESPVICGMLQDSTAVMRAMHHYILFVRQPSGFPLVEVGFYGSVRYQLHVTRPLSVNYFEKLSEMTNGCSQLCGIKYAFDIKDKKHSLWGLMPHRKMFLGSASGVMRL